MGYRYFILMAIIVCSCTSASAAESDVGAILSLRADSNAGLLAHDADRVLLHTAEEFILVGGTSGGHVGKSVVRRYYMDGFAIERGKWQGVWRNTKTGSLMSGEYLAHWMKKDGGWVTLAEVYVTLHCSGPICSP